MNPTQIKNSLQKLHAEFVESDIQSVFREDFPEIGKQNVSVLLTLDEDLFVQSEICYIDTRPECTLLQIHTALVNEITKNSILEEITKSLEYWNLYSPIGYFNVYRAQKQFYHRYTLLLDSEADEDAMVMSVLQALSLIAITLRQQLPLLDQIASGQMTCQQALARNAFAVGLEESQ